MTGLDDWDWMTGIGCQLMLRNAVTGLEGLMHNLIIIGRLSSAHSHSIKLTATELVQR